jgi:hypothetical protein
MTDRPTIREGDVGSDVKDLLDLLPTYYFDASLTEAVENYQRSRGLEVDGIVGPQTWHALESNAPPYVPPSLPEPMSPPALNMARANTHNSDKDALSWYAGAFDSAGMSNDTDGPDTLRHLWVLILGLGMRESSCEHCCGRDQSASNTSSNTAEAGAWQTSYDAHGCSPDWDTLFDAFSAGAETDNPQGFLDVFREDVACSSSDWQYYGSGNGYLHQEMSKYQPAYAAEVCGITLRNLRQHYGPVNRREVELSPEADEMLEAVQRCIDREELADRPWRS